MCQHFLSAPVRLWFVDRSVDFAAELVDPRAASVTLQTLLVVLVNCIDRFPLSQSMLDTDGIGQLVVRMMQPTAPSPHPAPSSSPPLSSAVGPSHSPSSAALLGPTLSPSPSLFPSSSPHRGKSTTGGGKSGARWGGGGGGGGGGLGGGGGGGGSTRVSQSDGGSDFDVRKQGCFLLSHLVCSHPLNQRRFCEVQASGVVALMQLLLDCRPQRTRELVVGVDKDDPMVRQRAALLCRVNSL